LAVPQSMVFLGGHLALLLASQLQAAGQQAPEPWVEVLL
jgi:hypothetical protein